MLLAPPAGTGYRFHFNLCSTNDSLYAEIITFSDFEAGPRLNHNSKE